MSTRLTKIYKRFNRKYFDGLLPMVTLSYIECEELGFAEPWKHLIELSNDLTVEEEKGTLLHEMLHIWQYFIEGKTELDTEAEWHDADFMYMGLYLGELSGFQVV